MTRDALLAATKLALRITGTTLDTEILDLIDAAFYDLEISGVADTSDIPYTVETADQLVVTAVKTYVKLNFGDLVTDPNMIAKLNESYYIQKAQLKMRRWSGSKIPSPGPVTEDVYRILENDDYLITEDGEES